MKSETIFALASGAGAAGIAVVRLSGPGAADALRSLAGTEPASPRCLTRIRLTDRFDGDVLDDGLACWFPGPHSFTGEDVVELHIHGGHAVIARVLRALASIDGLRLAEPGEFTRRAFENGKMDLTAAEGLADLVAAETEAQRRQALKQAEGALGRFYEDWRARLIAAQAHLEASIDFSDEDLPAGLIDGARRDVMALRDEIAAHLDDGHGGERLRDGIQVAIIGPPNAGKSSLLNLLARRDAAIVSEIAGTTRDVIEVRLDLGGVPVTIADTAGLRDGADAIEIEGVRRAARRGEEADLRLAVFDVAGWPATDGRTAALIDADTVVVINKTDLADPKPPLAISGQAVLPISALTGAGIERLERDLTTRVAALVPAGGAPQMTRARHREALTDCRAALARFLEGPQAELAAEDLRLAARSLGRITGRVDVEDMLDVIFRDFCIGK